MVAIGDRRNHHMAERVVALRSFLESQRSPADLCAVRADFRRRFQQLPLPVRLLALTVVPVVGMSA